MIAEHHVLAAIATVRARWTHAPLDPRDVEERVAIRAEEGEPVYRVIATPPACRIFRMTKAATEERRAEWVSRYVHAVGDVDGVLDELARRAG